MRKPIRAIEFYFYCFKKSSHACAATGDEEVLESKLCFGPWLVVVAKIDIFVIVTIVAIAVVVIAIVAIVTAAIATIYIVVHLLFTLCTGGSMTA